MIDLSFVEIKDCEMLGEIDYHYENESGGLNPVLMVTFRGVILGEGKRLGIIFYCENTVDLELIISKIDKLREIVDNRKLKKEEKIDNSSLIWDGLFKEIMGGVLKGSFTTGEVKEIFAIGLEVYKYKSFAWKKVFDDKKKETSDK